MEKFIKPLFMNGLSGRMLRMTKPGSEKEFLLIYGHHASLERMFSFAEYLNQFGNVTMPDLPGFGGMDSFYKIDDFPTIDAYADYLASFIKLRYKHKKVIIIGMSLAVPIYTLTLQKYPELTRKVSYLVSVAGFVHKEDFKFSRLNYRLLKLMTSVGSRASVSIFLSKFIVRRGLLRLVYFFVAGSHSKTKNADKQTRNNLVDFEAELWVINDLRTWFFTIGQMLIVDLCNKSVNVQAFHVSPRDDAYFNKEVVRQHMQIVYPDFTWLEVEVDEHVPSVVSSKEGIEPYIPKDLRKVFAKSLTKFPR